MQALKSLHTRLETVRDLNDVDSVSIIEPFIAVVESPHTTGPMTGAALSSLHKFLLYGFMGSDSPRAREGIDLIARGISNFHFEETDPESDEVVLMKVSANLAVWHTLQQVLRLMHPPCSCWSSAHCA
jgi:brefeldin A-resistance guanine nucleotide exchange factor 1